MNELIAVIVCGGSSTRMGKDKSLLIYHDKAQRYHLYDIAKEFCKEVVISCNKNQAQSIAPAYSFCVDMEEYKNAGPLTGILSSFEKFPKASILAIGCDYPYLQKSDIAALVMQRNQNSEALCFSHPKTQIPEPLLAIYENSCKAKLIENYYHNRHSLRSFLGEVNALLISPEKLDCLRSIDSETQINEDPVLKNKIARN